MRHRARFLMLLLLAAVLLAVAASPAEAGVKRTSCRGNLSTAEQLNRVFSGRPSKLAGGDYARALRLADGRTLWTFQDVFIGGDDRLGNDRFVHNAVLVQQGTCFTLRTQGRRSFFGGGREQPMNHWFWPLDAEQGADGRIHVFLAEMVNPNGNGAATGAQPVATWVAVLRSRDLKLLEFRPAPDPGPRLYGWSIVTDANATYLFGNCSKQFVPDAPRGFEACSRDSYLARVPPGQLLAAPEYWAGTGWSADPGAAVPVLTRGDSNPMHVVAMGGRYVSVTKLDDWFGSDLFVDVASAPEGPWTTVAQIPLASKCGEACNTYGAAVLPTSAGNDLVVALSNNAFDMRTVAYPHASWYRPSFLTVSLPTESPPA